MTKEYKFAKYPIYSFSGYVGSRIRVDKKTHLTKEELISVQSLDMLNFYGISDIVLFPGFEKNIVVENHYDNSLNLGNAKNINTYILPSLLEMEPDPAKFSQKIRDLAVNLYSANVKQGNKMYMEHELFLIARNMVKTRDFWDDKFLFRFYTINEFCGSKVASNKTFGEYISENMDKLYENFRIGVGHRSNFTFTILSEYLENGNFMRYSDLSTDKNEPLIMSLTKDEVQSLYLDKKGYYPSAFGNNYTRVVLRIVSDIKAGNVAHSNESITKISNNLIEKSLATKNLKLSDFKKKPLVFEGINKQKSWSEQLINSSKMKILDKLSLIVDKVEPHELLAFLLMLSKPKYFFNHSTIDSAYDVVLEALSSENFTPEEFVKFVAETVMHYDLELPTCSDWQTYLQDEGSFSDEIPPSIAISFILNKERKHKRGAISKLEKDRKMVYIVKKACGK